MKSDPQETSVSESETAPAPEFGGSRCEAIVLWLATASLILLFAALPVIRHQWLSRSNRDEDRISLNFRLISQYAVGTYHLQKMAVPDSQNLTRDLIRKVEVNAETQADKLFVAVVQGELSGKDRALAHVDESDLSSSSPQLKSDAAMLTTLYQEGSDQLTKKQRQGLLRRYRWFGELALAFDQDADGTMRQAAELQAYLVFGMSVTLLLGLFGGGAVGAALLVLAGVLLHFRKFRLRYKQTAGTPTGTGIRYFELFFLFLAALLFISFLSSLIPIPGLWLLQPAVLLLVLWLPFRKVSREEARRGLGLHPGKGILREFGSGAAGYLAGVPILIAGITVSAQVPRLIDAAGLSRYLPDKADHPAMEQLARGSTLDLIALFLMACVVAPIVEETFFRGALYHYLRRNHGFVVAALLSAFLFAAVHPQSLVGIPALTAIGFMLAMLREWRGSLVAPILAHAMHNGLILTFGLLINR